MAGSERMVARETYRGRAVTAGDLTVIPQSQAIVLRWPGGGMVWNRPVGVVVEQGGESYRIPIIDVTRLAVLLMLGLSALLVVMSVSRRARGRKGDDG